MADRKVKVILDASIGGFTGKMTAAGKSVGDFAAKATGAEKESAKFRRGLTSIGDTAGKIGLVASAGLGAAVLTAANFDQAMSNVRAATHETAENMELLREAAIRAGADTAFSASEAASGIEELAKAGVATSEILDGGLSGALDLAAAGGIGVGEAAEYAARAMSQFSLDGSQVPHVADLLAAAAGKAVGEVSDFGQALNQAGLVAAQTGLSIEDTTGVLAAFAQAGLQGSDAGTSLKSMLQRLQNPLGKGAETMQKLGISAYDASGNFVGIAAVADQLRTKLEELTPAQRDAAMAQIFGSDAVRAANVLYKEGADGIQGWIDKVNDQGYAAETASIKMDNLKGDWEEFTGSVETALIGMGEGGQGPLRSLVQGATDLVNVFNGLPGPVQSSATALLGITAVTGGSLWFGSKVIRGVSDTRDALRDLGIDAGKTGRSLAKIGATAGGILAVGMAAGALADNINRIDPNNIDRSLEALGQGRVTSQMKDVIDDLNYVTDWTNAVDLGEVVTAFGLFGDSTIDKATQNIAAYDKALAGMVESGRAAEAKDIFDAILADANDVDDARSKFEQYRIALDNASGGAEGTAGAQKGLAAATGAATAETKSNTEALQDNIDAMREKRNLAISALNAEIGYEAALDDARASLKENGKTLDITTAKGRANKSALLDVAAAWNEQSEAAKNAPGAHKAAIRSFVNLATQMGMGEKQARQLARRILEIPSKNVKVTADTSQAERQLSILQQMEIYDKSFKVTAVYGTAGATYTERAPGGKFASGGYTGDIDPRAVAGVVHGREFVFSADATEGNEAFLDQLHRNLRGYADGGYVVPGYATGGSVTRAEARSLARGFNLTPNLGVAGVRRELEELRKGLREAGGTWTTQLGRMWRQTMATTRSLERQRKELDQARASLKELRSEADSYRSSVIGSVSGDVFGSGLEAAMRTLGGDTATASSMLAAGRRAQRLGLSRSALSALLASGDVAAAQELDTRFEVAQLNRMFAERTRAQQQLGGFARGAVFGDQIAAARRDAAQEARVYRAIANRLEGLENSLENATFNIVDSRGVLRGTIRGELAGAAGKAKKKR